MSPIDRLISALEAHGHTVRQVGDSEWITPCSAHDDRNASLSLGVGDDGRALVNCHAGCDTADVVAAVGLDMRDLFPDQPQTAATKSALGDRANDPQGMAQEAFSPMQANRKRARSGIDVRHRKDCATGRGKRCNCEPGYRAEVFSARDGRKIRKTFSTPDEAKRWRAETEAALRDGRLIARRTVTFRVAANEFLDGIRDGSIRNRSGDRYKPSAIREYERAFRLRLFPAIGAHKLADIRRSDLQRLVGRWLAQGLDPSTIRNTINAVRSCTGSRSPEIR